MDLALFFVFIIIVCVIPFFYLYLYLCGISILYLSYRKHLENREDGEEYLDDIPYFSQIPEKSPSASPEKVYFGHSAEQVSAPLKMYPSVAADSARGHPVPQIKKYTATTGNPPVSL